MRAQGHCCKQYLGAYLLAAITKIPDISGLTWSLSTYSSHHSSISSQVDLLSAFSPSSDSEIKGASSLRPHLT